MVYHLENDQKKRARIYFELPVLFQQSALIRIPVVMLVFLVIHEMGHTIFSRLLGDLDSVFYLARIDEHGTCLGCNIYDHTKLALGGNILVSIAGLLATQSAALVLIVLSRLATGRRFLQNSLGRTALHSFSRTCLASQPIASPARNDSGARLYLARHAKVGQDCILLSLGDSYTETGGRNVSDINIERFVVCISPENLLSLLLA